MAGCDAVFLSSCSSLSLSLSLSHGTGKRTWGSIYGLPAKDQRKRDSAGLALLLLISATHGGLRG